MIVDTNELEKNPETTINFVISDSQEIEEIDISWFDNFQDFCMNSIKEFMHPPSSFYFLEIESYPDILVPCMVDSPQGTMLHPLTWDFLSLSDYEKKCVWFLVVCKAFSLNDALDSYREVHFFGNLTMDEIVENHIQENIPKEFREVIDREKYLEKIGEGYYKTQFGIFTNY